MCIRDRSYIQQPIDVLVQKALEILIDIIINGNTVQSAVSYTHLDVYKRQENDCG